MIDVAIIGSGIIGLACARAIAKSGRRVVVFDPAPERAAARVAAGMLSPWSDHPDDVSSLEMRERALSLYPAWIASIEEETGTPLDFAVCGTILLDDADGSVRAGLRKIGDRAGVRPISQAEILAASPDIGVDASANGGFHVPAEGYVDPRMLLEALRARQAYGIEFRDEAVRAIEPETGPARCVVTSTGKTEARHVVNATGAWAAALATGDRVRPIRGEIVVLKPPRGKPRAGRVVIRAGSTYIVPRQDATVVVGGTTADVGFDARATAGGIDRILLGAFAVVPALREWGVQEVRAGLRPFLDGGPCIGRDPERAGLVHAIGMNRHGILLAPFAAERVLEEIEG